MTTGLEAAQMGEAKRMWPNGRPWPLQRARRRVGLRRRSRPWWFRNEFHPPPLALLNNSVPGALSLLRRLSPRSYTALRLGRDNGCCLGGQARPKLGTARGGRKRDEDKRPNKAPGRGDWHAHKERGEIEGKLGRPDRWLTGCLFLGRHHN